MTISLADMAKLAAGSKDTLKLGVVQTFRKSSKIMDMLSFESTGTLDINFLRAKSMPTPAFRKIGNAYTATKGDVEPVSDRIYLLGGNVDIDKALDRQKGIVDGRTFHTKLQLEAIARMFNDYFINGNPQTDVDGLTGLWYRVINDLPASQNIDGALDISPDTAVTSWESKAVDMIEAMLDAVEGGADALLMNRTTKLRLESAFRKQIAYIEDPLGKKWSTYGTGGPILLDVGEKRDETSTAAGTKIIGNVELSNGTALTGGACTSIYAVKFGKMNLGGAQEYGLEVTDKGELDDGVTIRTVVDWPVGIYVLDPRSVARTYGIVAA